MAELTRLHRTIITTALITLLALVLTPAGALAQDEPPSPASAPTTAVTEAALPEPTPAPTPTVAPTEPRAGVAESVEPVAPQAEAAGSEGEVAGQEALSVWKKLIGIPPLWWIAPIGACIALYFASKFYKEVKAADQGDADMIEIAGHVTKGALAYLKRQYTVVTVVFIVLACILGYMAYGLKVQNGIVPFAFLTGGFFSGLCGYLGMRTATMASNRTAAGARKSLNDGLTVAFRAGAVMGMVVVGFALIDITGWFLILRLGTDLHLSTITVIMLTFGMGASTQALFARVGGGIYTKAADVGADLVGKVEAGIPEDDPRNPATIADNVGDNVGDVAGMGADLYESYCGSILATAALGVAAAVALFGTEVSGEGAQAAIRFLAAPMVLAGVGILLSIAGIYLVKSEEKATMAVLMRALNKGIWGSSAMIAIAAGIVCLALFSGIEGVKWYGLWGSILAGLVGGLVIGYSTEYYTSYDYKPTKAISAQGITGPATIIIGGIAEGMKSTWAALATIIIAILLAYNFAGGGQEYMLGLYGVGIAAVGMLATLGITLATDAYGPIADNAGGNAEMTGQEPHVRQRTDALDALGNTTAATGKGFAIGSAALTALALLAAYVEEVRFGQLYQARDQVVDIYQAPTPAEAVYMGHGKFGNWKEGDGQEYEHFDAFMALELTADLKTKLTPFETKVELGAKSGKDQAYVQTAAVIGDDALRLKLVPTKKASLAQFMEFYNVTLMNPKVLCGLFSGVLLAFLFCSLTMKAVGRAANQMIVECRRQFEKIRQSLRNEGKDEAFVQDPDNWPKKVTVDNHVYPDYANCVAISTAGAQKEMIFPALLAISVPVVVGLVFGVAGVMGLLAGGLTSGFALAIFMANAGGAWDNAKKLIETYGKISAKQVVEDQAVQDKLPPSIRAELVNRAQLAVNAGQPDMIIYGKGSEDHKAGVVGDTVGDPFKDTSGPSLNILIKLMSMVSVVFAGLIVKFAPQIGAFLHLGG
ncbi:MAG: sodium-translocating pyrophosphatase [Phycisphaerae bacterium]|nr:sodium-translocating pyrophosphatase [Phycisphaerae bacterium]